MKGTEARIEHPTSNIQHPTSNIQHPTSNIELRMAINGLNLGGCCGVMVTFGVFDNE